ncbi:MAG: AbiV family abortive infection protein, partial [Nitrosopumilaceae archaeon]|nr:AbiV family abortive infection protein [Nitrosopumilaceae archaeon]NIU00302.1 AbiV family abortive infection protein [Nitrosopumilaceae archaeon]NIU86704.1 AbiV family abortive infection protein [Nitrosopumilaceae archaeon]NIV65405.1 AbiV family abortive infection protein [Nitrosopumilaceae archaeon]NIX60904.1 AbiV family abortive infection protein [Nitrosopumilaceae archaeon]
MTKKIPKSRVKEGFTQCHSVIKRLLNDAELNLKNGRYSSSIALSILAIEELAKSDLLRSKIIRDEELTYEEWDKLTFGKKAHLLKLNWYPTKRKEKLLNRWSDLDIQALNEANKKLGFPNNFANRDSLFKEIELSEKVNPKLNQIKQDCFYLKWDKKNSNWTTFEKKFSDKVKKAIATWLVTIVRHDSLLQQYFFEYPKKPVKDWTDEDWCRLTRSKLH